MTARVNCRSVRYEKVAGQEEPPDLPEDVLVYEVFAKHLKGWSSVDKAARDVYRNEQFKVCKKIKQKHSAKVLFAGELVHFAEAKNCAGADLCHLNQKIMAVWKRLPDGTKRAKEIDREFQHVDKARSFERFERHVDELAKAVLELPQPRANVRRPNYKAMFGMFLFGLAAVVVFVVLAVVSHLVLIPVLLPAIFTWLPMFAAGVAIRLGRDENEEAAIEVQKQLGRTIAELQEELLPRTG